MNDIGTIREYWDRQPCNSNHSCAEIGSRTYFDEIEKRRYIVHPHVLKFADFEYWRAKKVLEIGCGIGTDAVNFVRKGADYTGIELSPRALSITEQRFKTFGLNAELHALNAEKLDQTLPHSSFDLIYSIGVIHHTADPKAIIAAARKVIKPDGELRMMVYAKNSWKAAMIAAGLDQPESQNDCPVVLTFDEGEIRQLLSGHFEVKDIIQDHVFPYQVTAYKNHIYLREPWFEAMPDEVFNALEKSMGWHFLVTAKPI